MSSTTELTPDMQCNSRWARQLASCIRKSWTWFAFKAVLGRLPTFQLTSDYRRRDGTYTDAILGLSACGRKSRRSEYACKFRTDVEIDGIATTRSECLLNP
jgi:hypothetical protein